MIVSKVGVLKCLETNIRLLSSQAAGHTDITEWNSAKLYREIPTQSIRDFLPGGSLFNVQIDKVHFAIKEKYGNLVKFPSMLGRKEIVISYAPEDFEIVYRHEGPWPHRIALDTITYWRKKVRKDLFKSFHGLVEEHGETWKKYRTIINPVMMRPQTVAMYVPKIDEVAQNFVDLVRDSRDAAGETPSDFGMWCQRYALESIGLVALDRRLDVLQPTEGNRGNMLATSVDQMFRLVYELDFLPSVWRWWTTPKFIKLMKTLDEIAGITMAMVEEAVQELKKQKFEKPADQQSVLEKLLKIDKDVAIVMAFDMLVVGIDTTSSSIKSMLYLLAKNPDKQEKLRQELRTIMPDKNTPLTAELIKNLPYLRACMKEQHRILPVVFGNARAAGNDLVLQGYQIPKGTDIILTHGLPSINNDQYGRSLEFIPERWLKDEHEAELAGCPHAKTAHPFAYMPFGFGNRACIGKRFAELETALITARMVRNFDMSWHYAEPKFQMAVVNTIISDLKIRLTDIDK